MSSSPPVSANTECISCTGVIPGTSLHVSCQAQHHLCAPCTAMYTLHCCEQAASTGSAPNAHKYVPLKCSIPECRLDLPWHILAVVIPAAEHLSADHKGLWTKYERLVVLQALTAASAETKQEELLLT